MTASASAAKSEGEEKKLSHGTRAKNAGMNLAKIFIGSIVIATVIKYLNLVEKVLNWAISLLNLLFNGGIPHTNLSKVILWLNSVGNWRAYFLSFFVATLWILFVNRELTKRITDEEGKELGWWIGFPFHIIGLLFEHFFRAIPIFLIFMGKFLIKKKGAIGWSAVIIGTIWAGYEAYIVFIKSKIDLTKGASFIDKLKSKFRKGEKGSKKIKEESTEESEETKEIREGRIVDILRQTLGRNIAIRGILDRLEEHKNDPEYYKWEDSLNKQLRRIESHPVYKRDFQNFIRLAYGEKAKKIKIEQIIYDISGELVEK